MPNHVHLIVGPLTEDGLRRAIGDAHRRYSRHVSFREGWRGHLFQSRFAFCVMDEEHLFAAARHVETNPVRAGFVRKPWNWKWSSAAAHRKGEDDKLVKVKPLLQLVGGWEKLLGGPVTEDEIESLRRHERTGRPLGSPEFVERIENALSRVLRPQEPKRKRKAQ